MLGEWFANPNGLWALLALIPILLLYLLRPRPREQTIPSLMFLLKDQKQRTYRSFFRYFVRDMLLLLQVLTVLALAFALAEPYGLGLAPLRTSDAVIVLDDSASMHTDAGTPRWREAQDRAIEALGPGNTIVLAGTVPRVALEDASAGEAQAWIRSWRPSHQSTRIAPAALAANDYVGAGGRLVIVSDFADTDERIAYQDVLQTISAQGTEIELVQVGRRDGQHDNVAIVGLDPSEQSATVTIKNYNAEEVRTRLCANDRCSDLVLAAGELVPARVRLDGGATRIRIDRSDDLMVDNEVVVSTPDRRTLSILVITNGDFSGHPLTYVLDSISESTPLTITVRENRPPTLTDIAEDIVIFTDVDRSVLVGETVREVEEHVRAGGAAIIMTQPDVFGAGYGDLLFLVPEDGGGSTPVRNTQSTERFAGLDFGSTPNHHRAAAARPAQVIAESPEGSPLIALASLGGGRVLWYGLPEEASFTLSPEYPLFWKSAFDELLGRGEVSDLNRRTGGFLSATVLTPSGEQESGRVLLAEQGLYQGERQTYAANLLDAQESSPAVPDLREGQAQRFVQEGRADRDTWIWQLLVAAIVLLFIELLYMKWRGDL